jgi:hypothetical protein
MSICTLTGTLLDTQGAALAGAVVTFTPVNIPVTGSGAVSTFSMPSVTTSSTGAFSIALEDNTYTVLVVSASTNWQTQFTITIPPGTTSGTIDQFTAAVAPPSGYSTVYFGANMRLNPASGLQIFNPATSLWHTVLIANNPPQLALDSGSAS